MLFSLPRDWRSGGVAEWRSGGLAEWRTGSVSDAFRFRRLRFRLVVVVAKVAWDHRMTEASYDSASITSGVGSFLTTHIRLAVCS